jgi:pilus assembly protein CpaE
MLGKAGEDAAIAVDEGMAKESVLETERSEFAMPASVVGSDSIGAGSLSIVLIGPDAPRRDVATAAFAACVGAEVREKLPYPASIEDVPRLLTRNFDIVAVDLDADREFALDLVARVCALSPASVMVYTEQSDVELLVRCMWAGAREFLTLPISPSAMADVMSRAASRRPALHSVQRAVGKLLVFSGCKGGSGVTTLACNFATELARQSAQQTLIIDLDLPLGDVAIHLGIRSEHSVVNALQDHRRLDSTLLQNLLTVHDSGLSVLGAPGQYVNVDTSDEAIEKLLAVARQHFDYVIVDAGSRPDTKATAVFKDASTIYLVAQVGVSELRNANRIIARFFAASGPRLQIVLNRYLSQAFGIDDEQISKALTKPAQWKIPTDSSSVQRMIDAAATLSSDDSPLLRAIRKMARNACGAPPEVKTRRWFDLFQKN